MNPHSLSWSRGICVGPSGFPIQFRLTDNKSSHNAAAPQNVQMGASSKHFMRASLPKSLGVPPPVERFASMQKGTALADARGQMERQRSLALLHPPSSPSSSYSTADGQLNGAPTRGTNVALEGFSRQGSVTPCDSLWNGLLPTRGGARGGREAKATGRQPHTTGKTGGGVGGGGGGNLFKVDQKVLARYNGGMEWWKGRVTNVVTDSNG